MTSLDLAGNYEVSVQTRKHAMDIQEMSLKIKQFCDERDWDQFHSPKELAIGMVTESAELLDHFRFLSDDQVQEKMSDPEAREEVLTELADVLFFVLRFAQRNDVDLASALEKKMKINSEKYPVDLAKGKNLKYNEFEN